MTVRPRGDRARRRDRLSPTDRASIPPSLNFAFCILHSAFCILHWRFAPRPTPRRAAYHDGSAVYITASHCDAYITCDAVASYHERNAFYITHQRCISLCHRQNYYRIEPHPPLRGPLVSPAISSSIAPSLDFAFIGTPWTSSPTGRTSIAPSPNFAFCLLHFALALRASPHNKKESSSSATPRK